MRAHCGLAQGPQAAAAAAAEAEVRLQSSGLPSRQTSLAHAVVWADGDFYPQAPSLSSWRVQVRRAESHPLTPRELCGKSPDEPGPRPVRSLDSIPSPHTSIVPSSGRDRPLNLKCVPLQVAFLWPSRPQEVCLPSLPIPALWFLPWAMISGHWPRPQLCQRGILGAAALVNHTHSLSPWTYVNPAFSIGSLAW